MPNHSAWPRLAASGLSAKPAGEPLVKLGPDRSQLRSFRPSVRHSMLRLALGALLIALITTPAQAAILEAIRPGVMCVKADALTKLSLPDGSSPLAVDNPSAAVLAIATAGECTTFPEHHKVSIITARANTTIVRSDTLSGDGILGTFIVPNIDFRPYSPTRDPWSEAIQEHCPNRLDDLSIRFFRTSSFIGSLPKPVHDKIDAIVSETCTAGLYCVPNVEAAEIEKRHLISRWADYMCRHPSE